TRRTRVRLSFPSTTLNRETPMSAFSERIRNSTKGFYKVADFSGGREITHTISHLDEEMEVFGEVKDILNFVETGRQLQLNQTTSEWLLNNLGEEPETWKGKRVVLYLADYQYQGKTDKGVRLKLPGDANKPAAKDGTVIPPTRSADRKGNRKPDFDDEIPY